MYKYLYSRSSRPTDGMDLGAFSTSRMLGLRAVRKKSSRSRLTTGQPNFGESNPGFDFNNFL